MHHRMAKNITLAIDEDLLDRVRVLAAMKRTSVNALVRDYLERLVRQEGEFDAVTQALLRLSRDSEADSGGEGFSREETYSGLPRFDR